MTLAPKIVFGFTGLALVAATTALWAKYGGLVYFDILASAFIGCFI